MTLCILCTVIPSVSLDQARALDAIERHGSFAAAAAALRKGHTSVLYLLRTLEDHTGLVLLDRSGYRTKLTAAGRRLAEACRQLLAAEAAALAACAELRAGWEPELKVVFDGVVPIEPLLRAVGALARERAPTRVDVRAEFLGGVEDAFARDGADLMIAVLPPRARLHATALAPVRASLVAHARHPLARGTHRAAALAAHVMLTVRGSDPRLELPTAHLEQGSTIHLNDFASKKAAIQAGIGYGWLPDYLIERELAKGGLKRVRWTGASTHVFAPRLYRRADAPLGRAAARLVAALDAR
ncbi:MAG: LysR family transcriptional regulator [Deltaproteobacteria bacterium]|nr:LysR family transcriptional regulator [Deltaproteobacteria bacterium]